MIPLNLILINKKINNQVVKIEHTNQLFIVYVRIALFEDWMSLKKLRILISWSIFILLKK